jgi:hypothetical protein
MNLRSTAWILLKRALIPATRSRSEGSDRTRGTLHLGSNPPAHCPINGWTHRLLPTDATGAGRRLLPYQANANAKPDATLFPEENKNKTKHGGPYPRLTALKFDSLGTGDCSGDLVLWRPSFLFRGWQGCGLRLSPKAPGSERHGVQSPIEIKHQSAFFLHSLPNSKHRLVRRPNSYGSWRLATSCDGGETRRPIPGSGASRRDSPTPRDWGRPQSPMAKRRGPREELGGA